MSTLVDRASLLELDLPGTVAPAPAPTLAAPVATPTARQELISAERALTTSYADGKHEKQAGRDSASLTKFEKAAARVAALPTVEQAATTLAATIAAEKRATSEVQLAGWRLDIDGKLREVMPVVHDNGKTGLRFMPRAIEIADHAVSQARGYAEADTGPNPNKWLGSIPGTNRLRARTRQDGTREAFSVLGPASKRGYVEFDADRVLHAAAKQLGGMNLKADVSYDEHSTRMTARLIAQAPVDIAAFNGTGRIHQIGVLLRAADNGSLSVQADGFVLRIMCMNGNMIRSVKGRTRVRHIGDVSRMGAALVAALDETAAAIPELTNLWQRAAVEHYVDKASGTALGMEEAFTRLVTYKHLPKCGLSIEDAVGAYMSAWRAEDSPTSSMGVIMAAQRAAHETTWRTQWAEDEVNEAAAQLLYQPISTLAEVEA